MRFLKERSSGQLDSGIKLVNAKIDPRNIIEASKPSTGSEIMDIAINKATEFAGQLYDSKRKNEYVEMKLNADSKVKEYEASWAGKDKFGEDNYETYSNGLKNILNENETLLANAKYQKSEDFDKWKLEQKQIYSNTLFKVEGEKNQYDTRVVIDKTMLNITALQEKYVTANDNEKNLIMDEVGSLMTTLNPLLPDGESAKFKMNIFTDMQSRRFKYGVENIINNGNLDDSQKLGMLNNLKENISNKQVYERDADELIEMGMLDKDMKEAYIETSMGKANASVLGQNGLIQKLNDKIENDRVRAELKAERDKQKAFRESMGILSKIESGYDITAIRELYEEPMTQEQLVNNPTIIKELFGFSNSKDILDDGKYVDMYNVGQLNDLKNKASVDDDKGVPRFDTVSEMYNIINLEDPIARENATRQFLASGLITPVELEVLSNNNSDSKSIINSSRIGRKSKSKNDLKGLISGAPGYLPNDFQNKISGMSFEQRAMMEDLIIGEALSGNYAAGINAKSKFGLPELKTALRDEAFKKSIMSKADVILGIRPKKYSKAQINKKKAIELVGKKYKNAGFDNQQEYEDLDDSFLDFE